MNDETYRALVEQSHQLQELTRHPGWPVFQDYLLTVVQAPITRSIVNGGAKDFEEYKERTGFCKGITRALNVPDEVGEQVLHERERRQEAEVAARDEAE